MAGKKNSDKDNSSWVGGIEKYSRKIWLAGLGIYSKIDQDGPKLFDTLVKDGEKAEKQAKKTAEDVAETAKSSTTSKVSGVKDRALGKWSELEEAFDKRLNSAISRLGVPSRNEIKALHQQVDTLTKQIEKLTGASVAPVSKPAATKSLRPNHWPRHLPSRLPRLQRQNLRQKPQRPSLRRNLLPSRLLQNLLRRKSLR